jgi:hypothetical protein
VSETPDPRPDDDGAAASAAGASRAASVSGAIGVVALVAAVVLYLAAGPPYGVNIGAGVLYLLGLLAALVAGVLLWLVWAEPGTRGSARRPAGIATASGALGLTCASVVVSLSHVASAAVQFGLILATAVVLAVAVGIVITTRHERP